MQKKLEVLCSIKRGFRLIMTEYSNKFLSSKIVGIPSHDERGGWLLWWWWGKSKNISDFFSFKIFLTFYIVRQKFYPFTETQSRTVGAKTFNCKDGKYFGKYYHENISDRAKVLCVMSSISPPSNKIHTEADQTRPPSPE